MYQYNELKNKIKDFCCSTSIVSNLQQNLLFTDSMKLTKLNKTTNSGKLSEWYVTILLEENNIDFIVQPRIYYGNTRRFLRPDFYIPSKDIFIEVKSRSYNMPGTASEKLDHVPRKYEILKHTDKYKNSKLLIVCCADEINQETIRELISPTKEITIRFLDLYKEHGNLIGYISVIDLYKYLS